MTTRERTMAVILIAFILVAGGGFFGYQFVLAPLQARDGQIAAMNRDIADRQEKVAAIVKRKSELERWQRQSLPADVDAARRDYEEELSKMLRASGFEAGSLTIVPKPPDAKTVPQLATKKPIYTKLIFTVQLKGDLASLVDFMGRFYKLRLLHQIRNMTVQKPVGSEIRTAAPGGSPGNSTPSTDLDVTLTIEALVLDNAEQRKTLLPDKAVDVPSVLARSESQYAMIAGKNLFYGPSLSTGRETRSISIDTAPFVRLNGIVSGENGLEATLWDTYHNWDYKITPRSLGGYNVEALGTITANVLQGFQDTE